MGVAIAGYIPGGESLCGVIRKRLQRAHSDGGVDTSLNLLRRATEDEVGPKLLAASDRFFRKVLARLGFGYARRRGVISAARQKPYVRRWG